MSPPNTNCEPAQSLSRRRKWEQGFILHARLPVDDGFSIRQDIRAGLQTETVLGDALSSTYRDALTLLEKTSAELRATEALRVTASIQEQWLANNQVPFAEIMLPTAQRPWPDPCKPSPGQAPGRMAGARRIRPRGRGTADVSAGRVDQEFVPKKLKASVGGVVYDSEDATGRTISERKWDAALFLSPDGERTALTLGADLASARLLATIRWPGLRVPIAWQTVTLNSVSVSFRGARSNSS